MVAFYFLKSERFPKDEEVEKIIKSIKKKNKIFEKYYKKAFKLLLRYIVKKEKKGEALSLNNFFKSSDAENVVNRLLK